MTPRRLEAMIFIAHKRRAKDRANFVMDVAAARSGDAKGLEKYVKDLLK
jgi:hypothetical protein